MEGGKHMDLKKAQPTIEEIYKTQILERRLTNRKKKINQILWNKRKVAAEKEGDIDMKDMHQEEKEEDSKRRTEDQRLPDLTKHHKHKPKWQSKKRCWLCKSLGHYKKNCPYIRCFYCGRLGHIKANCFIKKMDKILEKNLQEMEKKKKKERRKKKRKEIKQHQTAIYKLRLKQSTFSEISGKNLLLWKETPIGVYLSHHPPPNLLQLRQKPINWKKIDVFVKKETPIIKLVLEEKFINWCGCGKIGLTKAEFIKHVYDIHSGKAPPSSHINRPPWIEHVAFYNDDIETLYCQTLEDLPID